jgi:hypothetical protein
MANFVYITLDTTAPTNPTISISGGAIFATAQLVNLTISVGDGTTTGYQMKIWGNVDTTHNANIQSTEANSSWIAYSTNPQVKLSAGDGSKSISIKVRDDVYNESSVVVDSIQLDTSIPTVTVTLPDVSKISKMTGKNSASFTFQSSENFVEYKVKLVGSTGATHDTGTLIPTTGGSTNVAGTGSFTSSTVTTVTIKGADLETAGATTNNQSIVKVFVKDSSGLWSV